MTYEGHQLCPETYCFLPLFVLYLYKIHFPLSENENKRSVPNHVAELPPMQVPKVLPMKIA